jgi:transposase
MTFTLLRWGNNLLESTLFNVCFKMVFHGQIDDKVKAYVKFLREEGQMSLRAVARKCNISSSSVKRITDNWDKPKQRTANKKSARPRGRPRKISKVQERYILRELIKLRRSEGTFSISRLMTVTGISKAYVTPRTVLNVLHRHGYTFRQTRKKGLLTCGDLSKRKRFATDMVKRPVRFWCQDVGFYLDAISFVFKTNPLDQARTPRSRIYRRPGEGLLRGCTTKGCKEGTGGKVAKFVVSITHGKGVISCEPYDNIMTGAFFAQFVDDHFADIFDAADKETNLFIQDGDPCQNSAIACAAMKRVKAQLLKIPARSPDLNPIENVFHIAGKKLREDAISMNLSKETMPEFKNRIVKTLKAIPREIIDKTIESTRKRLKQIIANSGQRTKY